MYHNDKVRNKPKNKSSLLLIGLNPDVIEFAPLHTMLRWTIYERYFMLEKRTSRHLRKTKIMIARR